MKNNRPDTRENDADDFIENLVVRDLSEETAGFDKEDIEFIRKNPEVLAKLSDATLFKKKYLYLIFTTAFVLLLTSKILEYTKVLENYPIANDIFTNILFSISMEIMGATLVAFLMELLLEKRIERNREIIEKLKNG